MNDGQREQVGNASGLLAEISHLAAVDWSSAVGAGRALEKIRLMANEARNELRPMLPVTEDGR